MELGFNVVEKEVPKLASGSAEALVSIAKLIKLQAEEISVKKEDIGEFAAKIDKDISKNSDRS